MAEDNQDEWWVAINDAPEGPFSVGDVRKKLQSSEMTLENLACPVGGTEWKALTEWESVFAVTPQSTKPPSPPPLPTKGATVEKEKSVEQSSPPGIEQDDPTPSKEEPSPKPDPRDEHDEKPEDKQGEAKPNDAGNEGQKQGSEAIVALVLGGLAVLAICYFFFVFVLWLLFGVSVLAAIACVLAAFAAESDGDTKGWFCGAGVAVFVAFGLWTWIGRYDIDIPSLPKKATAKEITKAYRDRVAHIQLMYASEERGFFSTRVEESGGTGSGLLIANDRKHGVIITNRHVVDPVYFGAASNVIAARYQVSLASEEDWHEARVAAIHRSLDLAILIVERRFRSRGTVRVASHAMIEQGDDVVALGNPFGVDFVTTEGIISKIDQDGVLTSCPINSGNSGGPLILQHRGLIAGFNTASRIDAQNFNVAVVAERVFQPYTPNESTTSGRRRHGIPGLIRSAVEHLGDAVASGAAADEDAWDWYADRDTVLELLEMVPIEEPK